jgi:hypothetical protein
VGNGFRINGLEADMSDDRIKVMLYEMGGLLSGLTKLTTALCAEYPELAGDVRSIRQLDASVSDMLRLIRTNQ